jgi:predicted aspartyl protease
VNAVKTLSRFCIVLLAVVSFANLNWAANPEAQSRIVENRTVLPFKLYGGYLIVVQGRVGEFGKLKFLLDTGVTHSVLDRKLADKIGPSRHSGQVLNFDKNVRAEWVKVPDIELGPIHVSDLSVTVGDLRYFQSFATQVDAVIGLDLLRLSSFSIDYDAHKVFFGPVDTASGVPMSSDAVCLSIQVLAGDTPIQLVVDTGAQGLVLYEDRVISRVPQLRIGGETAGTSMGGWVLSKRAFIPNARLGTTDLGGTVFLVKTPTSKVLSGIDGYLGTAALKARRINFNFETNTLAWKR